MRHHHCAHVTRPKTHEKERKKRHESFPIIKITYKFIILITVLFMYIYIYIYIFYVLCNFIYVCCPSKYNINKYMQNATLCGCQHLMRSKNAMHPRMNNNSQEIDVAWQVYKLSTASYETIFVYFHFAVVRIRCVSFDVMKS